MILLFGSLGVTQAFLRLSVSRLRACRSTDNRMSYSGLQILDRPSIFAFVFNAEAKAILGTSAPLCRNTTSV